MSKCILPIFDLSGMYCVNQSQKLMYNEAVAVFSNVFLFNSNVSTLHQKGYIDLPYYTFSSFQERNSYKQGQYLYKQRYPNSNWNSVQEN